MADFALILAEGAAEPASFGLITATGWVSIAMAIFIGILLWKKVPTLVAGMLDNKIAEISKQLKEAEGLRLEAEALKGEYEAKLAAAAKEAEEMRARADAEAQALVAKAKADATALIARRKQMAEERIAAAEANALAEVRTAAAQAATEAAAKLIAEKHDAATDKALVDKAIASVAKS